MGNAAYFEGMVGQGHHWEREAVKMLLGHGLDVKWLNEGRATVSDDGADILAYGWRDKPVRLGVKSRCTPFTCVQDYPHPKCLVDSVRALTRAPLPAAHLVVSQPTGAWIVIPMSTKPHWRTFTVHGADGPKECYWIPPKLCTTVELLVDWIKYR